MHDGVPKDSAYRPATGREGGREGGREDLAAMFASSHPTPFQGRTVRALGGVGVVSGTQRFVYDGGYKKCVQKYVYKI